MRGRVGMFVATVARLRSPGLHGAEARTAGARRHLSCGSTLPAWRPCGSDALWRRQKNRWLCSMQKGSFEQESKTEPGPKESFTAEEGGAYAECEQDQTNSRSADSIGAGTSKTTDQRDQSDVRGNSWSEHFDVLESKAEECTRSSNSSERGGTSSDAAVVKKPLQLPVYRFSEAVKNDELVFVSQDKLHRGLFVEIDPEQSQHLRARRVAQGDSIGVFDGMGTLGCATFRGFNKANSSAARVKIDTVTRFAPVLERTRPFVTGAVGFPKGSRGDWVVEKLTELGVHRLVPLDTERLISVPTAAKSERWMRIMLAASKQSFRPFLPQLTSTQRVGDLVQFMQSRPHALKLIGSPGGAPLAQLLRMYEAQEEHDGVIFAVGPEGGFSPMEEEQIVEVGGASRIDLGDLRLRTETAAIAMATALMLHFGERSGSDDKAL